MAPDTNGNNDEANSSARAGVGTLNFGHSIPHIPSNP